MSHQTRLGVRILGISVILLSSALVFTLYQYYSLKSSYQSLSREYEEKSSILFETQSLYSSLSLQYEQLSNEHNSLKKAYFSLEANRSLVEKELTRLQSEYSSLNSTYYSLVDDKSRIEEWYGSIRREINLRQGISEEKKRFITPNDPEVGRIVFQTTGGWSRSGDFNEFWSDLKKMYDWTTNNVGYSYDSPSPVLPEIYGRLEWRAEFFRYPNETIFEKHGDCEDQALLLASMILNYLGRGFTVWVVEWVSDSSAHMAVAMPVEGGRLTILDPAGRFHTSSESGEPGSKPVRQAVEEWVEYWEKQGQHGVRISLVFSEETYRIFLTTEEFIQWVLRS
jgi:hypothetical protein